MAFAWHIHEKYWKIKKHIEKVGKILKKERKRKKKRKIWSCEY